MSNPYTLPRPKSLHGDLVLWLLLVPIGIHRFAWWLVDLFLVAGRVRDHNAAIGDG